MVVASQLVSRIAVEGDDSARSKLSMFGKVVDQAQHAMSSKLLGATKSSGAGFLDFASKSGMAILGLKELVGAALATGNALLRPHADLENFTASFKTFLKTEDAAKSMMGSIQNLADTIAPFETSALASGASNLLAMKIQAQDVVPFMTSIGNAVAGLNLESYQLGDIARLFGEINSTGYATGETLSQLRERGIDAYGILREKLGLTSDQLDKMLANHEILASDALPALRDGLNEAFPDAMLNKSKTLDGRLSTITDGFKKLWVLTTKPIFTSVSEGAGKLVEVLSNPALINFATGVGVQLGNTMQQIGNFVTTQVVPGFQQLQPVVDYLAPIFQQFGTSLQNLGIVVAPLLVQFGQWLVKSGVLRAYISILVAQVGLFFQGLTLLAQGLTNVITFFSTGGSNAKGLWNILAGIGGFLASTFKPVWDQLVTTFKTQLLPAWNDLMKALQPTIPVFQFIGAIIGGILVVAIGVLVGAIGGIIGAFAGMLPGLIQAFGGIIQFISGFIQLATGITMFFIHLVTGQFDKLGGDLNSIWSGIASMFIGLWNVIAGAFLSFIGLIVGFVSGFIAAIVGFFTNLYNTLVGHSIIPDMINGIIGFFAQLPGKVIAFVLFLINAVIAHFRMWYFAGVAIIGDLANGIMNAFNAIPGFFAGIGNSMWEGIKWGINMIIGGINNFISFMNGIKISTPAIELPGVSIPAASVGMPYIPPIPKLATGGAITQGGFADVHRDERLWLPTGAKVIRASQAQAMREQPQIVVQPPPIYLDGRLLASGLMPYIVDGIRHGTGNWGM